MFVNGQKTLCLALSVIGRVDKQLAIGVWLRKEKNILSNGIAS
jgi:hypothetical protein